MLIFVMNFAYLCVILHIFELPIERQPVAAGECRIKQQHHPESAGPGYFQNKTFLLTLIHGL